MKYRGIPTGIHVGIPIYRDPDIEIPKGIPIGIPIGLSVGIVWLGRSGRVGSVKSVSQSVSQSVGRSVSQSVSLSFRFLNGYCSSVPPLVPGNLPVTLGFGV